MARMCDAKVSCDQGVPSEFAPPSSGFRRLLLTLPTLHTYPTHFIEGRRLSLQRGGNQACSERLG